MTYIKTPPICSYIKNKCSKIPHTNCSKYLWFAAPFKTRTQNVLRKIHACNLYTQLCGLYRTARQAMFRKGVMMPQ